MNHYHTSTGERVTQGQINIRYRKAKSGAMLKYVCEGCGKKAHDVSHTIAQIKCKDLHKTELIWDEENWSFDCRDCHHIWESYKSGLFTQLKNFAVRMFYVEKHDPEGYRQRMNFV